MKYEVKSMKCKKGKEMNRKTIRSGVLSILILYLSLLSPMSALTLKESLDIAMKSNPLIISAKEKVNVASARMGQAGSAVLPTVTLSASKGKNYSQPMTIALPSIFGGGTIATGPDETSDYSSYSLGVQQALFTGGKILTGLSIASAVYDSSQEDLRKAQQDVEFNVVSSYFEYQKAKKRVEIIDATIANLERNLAITQVMYNSGIVSISELLRIKTSIANYQVLEIQACSMRDIAELAFEAAVGVKFPGALDLEEENLSGFSGKLPSGSDLLSIAYKNRPDYLSYIQALKVAGDAINMAYSGYLPNIAFSYSTGKAKTEYNKNTTSNSDLNNWRAMFVGSWNLFDGLNTENKIREAYATLASAKAQQQSIQDALSLDVNSSYLTLLSAVKRVSATEIAEDLAGKTLRSVEVSYGADTISRQIYLETQTAYLVAAMDLWGAKYDLEVAKARLNRSVGKKVT
ncbi:MAG: TolC family protein [Candidatus Margulisiibacteriota bacterium]